MPSATRPRPGRAARNHLHPGAGARFVFVSAAGPWPAAWQQIGARLAQIHASFGINWQFGLEGASQSGDTHRARVHLARQLGARLAPHDLQMKADAHDNGARGFGRARAQASASASARLRSSWPAAHLKPAADDDDQSISLARVQPV